MTTLAARGSGTPATTGTTWATVTNAVDGAAGTNPATYATATNATASAVATIEITGYNFSTSIAATDTLNSVTVSLRHFENNTGRFASVRFQAFDGATAIGTATTCTLATAARNDTATPAVTLAQLRSSTFKIVVTITGAASTQSRVESIDYVDVTADYTIVPPSITQAAYRFYADGTETGATALAAQDTGYTADTSSGDVNLQVRIRLQSTTAIAVAATDDFQLQLEKNSSGTWLDVTSTGAEILASTVPTSAMDGDFGMGSANISLANLYQAVLGNGQNLTRVRFHLQKTGSPTALLQGRLATHTGTFGTTSAPSTVIETSTNTVAGTTLTTTNVLYQFDFSGSTQLVNGTPYCIGVGPVAGGTMDASNYFAGGYELSGPHPGVLISASVAQTDLDLVFEMYTQPVGSIVLPYASANLTDGAATTNRLGAGTGSFVAGKISETGLVTDLGWTANNYTEVLYSVTLKQADLTPTDTLKFRVLRNGATTNLTYTQTPTITIGAGGPTDRTGTATGSISISGTASGAKDVTGTATGSLTLSGAAAGVGATPGNDVTGTATGALSLAGASAGTRGTPATATGTLTVTATATGQKTVGATATGSLNLAGTSSGIKTVTATATGALALTGTAAGAKTVAATAAGSLTLTGTATGTATAAPVLGQATSSLTITGTATGTHGVAGTAAGSFALAGTATGVRGRPGAATGTLSVTGTASATKQVTGTAVGQVVFASSALGLVEGNAVGTATGTIGITGTAAGTRGTPATATGALSLQGLATGTRGTPATVVGTLTLQGLATGTAGHTGIATGALTLTGAATSVAVSTVVGEWNDADVVAYQYGADPVVEWFMLISVERKATATGGLTFGATATGTVGHPATATGSLTFIGVAAGTVAAAGTDVLFEPFNNFTDAPWTATSTPTIVTGRTGTACQANSTGQRADFSIPVGQRSDTLTIGFAWRRTDALTSERYILAIWTALNDFEQNELKYNVSTGLLRFTRLTSTVASTTYTFTQNVWYYIEVQTKLGDAPNGFVIVRVNGVEVINATGLDTNPQSNTVHGAVRLWCNAATTGAQWDDLYITTGAGAAFKGDITV